MARKRDSILVHTRTALGNVKEGIALCTILHSTHSTQPRVTGEQTEALWSASVRMVLVILIPMTWHIKGVLCLRKITLIMHSVFMGVVAVVKENRFHKLLTYCKHVLQYAT